MLAPFDPNLPTIVSADASSYGLGAVLLQEQENREKHVVAYISRAMSPTEQRYAQIEKEGLALTWACKRFQDFLVGLHFRVETDHKPLVPLFNSKLLDELPLHIQRFRMKMMRFSFSVQHVPGKQLSTADTLSRAPVSVTCSADEDFAGEVDAYVQTTVSSLQATEKRLEEVRVHQQEDPVCRQVTTYCFQGWPSKSELPESVRPFHSIAGELSVQEGLLMRGSRLFIPASLRAEILTLLHASHQGISKTRERARQSVWWPGLSKELERKVQTCPECTKAQAPRAEPLIPSSLPELPWQKVATDLFEWKKASYLLIVDYYSRWIEISKLEQMTSQCVINHMSSVFARYGIPEVVVSDNGPQYTSEVFRQFARDYRFVHSTSSPHFPQSNGEAERAVQTVKGLLKKAADPYLALLAYRATPLAVGYTPSELLMGRKLRTTVPISRDLRRPMIPDHAVVTDRDKKEKERQTKNFNSHHGVRPLPVLQSGSTAYVKDRDSTGTVLREVAPRSYLVDTPDGVVRRNRRHLIESDTSQEEQAHENQPGQSEDATVGDSPRDTGLRRYSTRLRSGGVIKPPDRLDNSWNKPGERGM